MNTAKHVEYGSDAIVETIRRLGIQFVALNPGPSFRGIHESLANMNDAPKIVLCCHETVAVAFAHGYAAATGNMMAVAVHDVVGLQNASMAIFNAWCDRIPILVNGGTGPTDTFERRPWVPWVHTALIQGNQVRDYVKWDDQPTSIESAIESTLRASRIARTKPEGPVYVCFDAGLQERRVRGSLRERNLTRFKSPDPPTPTTHQIERIAGLLANASWPVIIADGLGRDADSVAVLGQIAELLSIPVLEGGLGLSIPSFHPCNLSLARDEVLSKADVILALDVIDLQWALNEGKTQGRGRDVSISTDATVVSVTLDGYARKSWVTDSGQLMPVDLPIAGDAASTLGPLMDALHGKLSRDDSFARAVDRRRSEIGRIRQGIDNENHAWVRRNWNNAPISFARLYGELWNAIEGTPFSLVRGPFYNSTRRIWNVSEPIEWFAPPRGGGLGTGVGMALGAAAGLDGSSRLPIAVLGDGEILYTPSAFWTAAHYGIAVLFVVLNNQSYFRDESHQLAVAKDRGRPLENAEIGIRLENPTVDFSRLAVSFGLKGFGPITDPDELSVSIRTAMEVVRHDRVSAVLDVVIGESTN